MRKHLENLRLMTKMIIPIALMLVVALCIVAFAENGLNRLRAQTHEIIMGTAARQALALSAVAAINSAAANEKNAMLMTDQTGLDAFASAYVADIDHLKADIAGLKGLTSDAGDIAALEAIEQATAAYYATGEQLYQLMVDKNIAGAHALSTGGAQSAREWLIELVQEEVDQTTSKMEQAEAEADALYRRTVTLLIAFSLAGLGAAVLLVGWITTRVIIRPLTKITDAMGRLTLGDLQVVIEDGDRRDEIGVLARALKVFREHGVALRQHEAELRAARDAAIVADRAKSEFLANMSHELRTPLNAVIGFAELMRDEVFGKLGNDRYRGYAADIQSSAAHLLAIINDILDLAKIDAGSMELHESHVDLAALCAASLTIIGPRALKVGITVDADAVPKHAMIWADERLLKQAVINLLSNAVKFSPPGDTVRLAVLMNEGAMNEGDGSTGDGKGPIEISVADHGIGMRKEDIPRVVKPFVQIDGALQRRYDGTGLGLPLTKSIVETHGGELDIDSAPGAGTIVTIRLPASRRRGAAVADEPSDASPSDRSVASLADARKRRAN
jgi:signal transduction histidine kinase